MFRSTDGGLTWKPFSNGLGNPNGTALLADGGRVVVGTMGSGVWVLTPMRLDKITPANGSADGGTLVVLSGDGFRADSTVTIGGGPTSEFIYFSPQSLGVRTGAGAPGPADVVVTNADGSKAVLPGAFAYTRWSCTSDAATLCLENGRFRITAKGTSGDGRPESLTLKSGYFWFGWNQNPEVVVKILDGRSYNGHYWIHVAALADVEFTATVTDTTNGRARIYRSAAGEATVRIDRDSF